MLLISILIKIFTYGLASMWSWIFLSSICIPGISSDSIFNSLFMAQLPEDFLSLKSLKSLTTAASITWILLLVIDVIFISGMEDEYRKLKWIWIIGLVIAFILSML